MKATIILTANCAFLAIPLFQAPKLETHSSPEQIASYLSLTTSLFGLILGMVMHRHHKTRRPATTAEIVRTIRVGQSPSLSDIVKQFNHLSGKRKKGRLGRKQHLALIWSSPHALVMWSCVASLCQTNQCSLHHTPWNQYNDLFGGFPHNVFSRHSKFHQIRCWLFRVIS